MRAHIDYQQPNTGDSEINHRIQVARVKFAQMSNLFRNFSINLHVRISFLNAFVRSRLTYSCQNWNLNKSQLDRIDVCYRIFLRQMLRGGFKRVDADNGDFRFRMSNEHVLQLCGVEDVSEFVKRQQINYAAHVVRMSHERSIKRLMFNSDKCTKPGRRAETLLEKVVKMRNSSLDAFCNDAMNRRIGKSA